MPCCASQVFDSLPCCRSTSRPECLETPAIISGSCYSALFSMPCEFPTPSFLPPLRSCPSPSPRGPPPHLSWVTWCHDLSDKPEMPDLLCSALRPPKLSLCASVLLQAYLFLILVSIGNGSAISGRHASSNVPLGVLAKKTDSSPQILPPIK